MRRVSATLGLLAAMTATVSSGQHPRSVASPATRKAAATAIEGQAIISGRALGVNATPLPNALVQLRNLESRQIEQMSTTSATGDFTFAARPDIPYVVEIADSAGRVLAAGDIVVAQAGDVASAVVSIPGRLPGLDNVFAETASAIVAVAGGTGIAILDPRPRLSPER